MVSSRIASNFKTPSTAEVATMDHLHNQGKPAFPKWKEPKKSVPETQKNSGTNQMFSGVEIFSRM